MGNVAAKATTHYTVPGGQVHSIEFCFYDLSDVVQDSSLVECEGDAVNCVLLHLLWHIAVLDNGVLSS